MPSDIYAFQMNICIVSNGKFCYYDCYNNRVLKEVKLALFGEIAVNDVNASRQQLKFNG